MNQQALKIPKYYTKTLEKPNSNTLRFASKLFINIHANFNKETTTKMIFRSADPAASFLIPVFN